MNNYLRIRAAVIATVFVAFASVSLSAQTIGELPAEVPEVIKVDDATIKPILKPNGKPLLVNFWATWCIPCVEEFPLLVELDKEYKGRIDFITVSLDDLAEIKRDVPKFLLSQSATMPAYLLHTRDENAVIGGISQNWTGGLPFTILFAPGGEALYQKQGIIKPDVIKPLIDRAVLTGECKPGETDN